MDLSMSKFFTPAMNLPVLNSHKLVVRGIHSGSYSYPLTVGLPELTNHFIIPQVQFINLIRWVPD